MNVWNKRNLLTGAAVALLLTGAAILDQQAGDQATPSQAGTLSGIGSASQTNGIDVWEHAYSLRGDGVPQRQLGFGNWLMGSDGGVSD